MKKENPEKHITNPEASKNQSVSEEVDIYTVITQSLENIYTMEPKGPEERWQKAMLQENLADVAATLREGGIEDPLNLLVTYRGLEQIQSQYSLDPEQEDFGIQQAVDSLRSRIQAIEGVDIEEAEDLDEMFEKSGGEIKEALKQNLESFSEEEALEQKIKFEKYFSLREEIKKRRSQIIGDSRNFYGGIAKKVAGPLISFLEECGEKIDNMMNDSRVSLLRYLGKYSMGSRIARGVGVSIIAAGALGYVFNGEIAEAAQHSSQGTELKPVDPEELKAKDPDMYRMLQEYGLIPTEKPAIRQETPPASREKEQYKDLSAIFKKALRNTEAALLLESPEYKTADTLPKLQELYKKFNEKDDDPSDNLAVMAKYHEFISVHSSREVIAEYGKKEAEEFFRQAGFVTYNSLTKYFQKDMEEGGVDFKMLPGYLEGFQKASELYKISAGLGEKYTKEKGLHRSLLGLIDINNTLTDISNTLTIYGREADKLTAASMRDLVYRNLKEFDLPKNKVPIISLGGEKILIPDVKELAVTLKNYIDPMIYDNWMSPASAKSGAGGMNILTDSFAEKASEAMQRGNISVSEARLLDLLVKKNILIKTKQGFAANPEKPTILFTTIEGYNHESQHYQADRNPQLVEYWTEQWNKMPAAAKRKFAKELRRIGYLQPLTQENAAELAQEKFSPSELAGINMKIMKGEKASAKEWHKRAIIHEFLAYSADNSGNLRFDPKHELPADMFSFD